MTLELPLPLPYPYPYPYPYPTLLLPLLLPLTLTLTITIKVCRDDARSAAAAERAPPAAQAKGRGALGGPARMGGVAHGLWIRRHQPRP